MFDGRLALIAAAIAADVLEAPLAQLDVQGIRYHLGKHARARHRYLVGTPSRRALPCRGRTPAVPRPSFAGRRPRAVCLGSFTDCPRRGVHHSLEQIIGEYLAPLGIPLYGDLPSGHGDSNRSWPYGQPARLSGSSLDW